MRGLFIVAGPGGLRVQELAKGRSTAFEAPSGGLEFGDEAEGGLFAVAWDEGSGTWIIEPRASCRSHGAAMVPSSLLSDGDSFEAGSSRLWFRKFPAPPRFRGAAQNEIPVCDGLVFGRGEAEDGSPFVGLDPEDRKLSRRHLVVSAKGRRFAIRDESQFGAFANGLRFDEHQLVVGDRILAGAYSFEFTGRSFRRVQPRIGVKVEGRALGFSAGGRQILSQIDLVVEPCAFAGILGGSGQGKSTLLNSLCGINPATEGEVLIDGQPLAGSAAMANAGIGFVPQDDIVHPELKVRDAVLFSARLRLDPRIPKGELHALVDETVARLGLAEHAAKRITQLSGGQRKRVSIATELLAKPAVLFLDEPSSGLDPATEFALMKILRGLAARDCTVICTTHVLGRAYLFDRIVFIHGGRVIFDGPPDTAYERFGVESLDQVYVRVAEEGRSGEEWAREFQSLGGSTQRGEPSPPALDLAPYGDIPPSPRRTPGFFTTLGVQIARQWSITASDPLNLAFLLAQPLLIALLIGWVAEDYVLRMFLCVVATLWFGCSNGAQQIVRELPIFRRERVCGLGLNAYLSSKYLFLGLLTIVQAILLLAVAQTTALAVRPPDRGIAQLAEEFREITSPPEAVATSADELAFEVVAEGEEPAPGALEMPDPAPVQAPRARPDAWLAGAAAWFFEARWNVRDAVESAGRGLLETAGTLAGLKLAALAATALVGVAIGLAISGLVQNAAQAVMWVPLLLIPQILFGGVVLSLPELSRGARAVCAAIPSFSCQRLMDVSNVYGQAVPLLSNRTKIPLFLTPGEKEEVRWEVLGRTYTEHYDKLAPANTSWQNLAVFPFAVGQHRHEFSTVETASGSSRKLYNQTAGQRADVRYAKGRVYLNLNPVLASTVVLALWLGVCYGGTLAALAMRQKGK